MRIADLLVASSLDVARKLADVFEQPGRMDVSEFCPLAPSRSITDRCGIRPAEAVCFMPYLVSGE